MLHSGSSPHMFHACTRLVLVKYLKQTYTIMRGGLVIHTWRVKPEVCVYTKPPNRVTLLTCNQATYCKGFTLCLVPRPHPLIGRNGVVNQAEFPCVCDSVP